MEFDVRDIGAIFVCRKNGMVHHDRKAAAQYLKDVFGATEVGFQEVDVDTNAFFTYDASNIYSEKEWFSIPLPSLLESYIK